MAFVHGKDSFFQIDNTSGTPTDVSAYTDKVDGNFEAEMADVTAFGDEGHRYVAGLENATIPIGGNWDSTFDAAMGSPAQLKAATRTFNYGPAGNTGGMVKYTGEAWVTNYTIASGVGDKVTWTANLQVDGQVSRSTF